MGNRDCGAAMHAVGWRPTVVQWPNLLMKPESRIFVPRMPDSLSIPAIIMIPSFEMETTRVSL